MSGRIHVTGRSPRSGRPLTVTVGDGLITAIEVAPEGDHDWLAAGLVDLQVNGFGGYDLNAPPLSPSTVQSLARRLFAEGVTTFVPTLITASHESVEQALRAIAAARTADRLIARAIPYVHLEGPHLSDQDGPRGVHDAAQLRPPSVDELTRWQAASGGLVGMVTLSPHFAESPAYITAAVAGGVHVSIGHTHADPVQIRAAAEAGATLSTHLGNGCHAVLPRHPNYLWAQLADDRLTAGFIADGHHLPADTLTAMIRAKGLSHSVLVSDAVALAGSPPGRYRTAVGGEVELHPDDRLSPVGDRVLAGAAKSLNPGVAYAAVAAGIGLKGSLRLAAENPGRFVGGRGRLAVGEPADLITFAWRPGEPGLRISSVLVGGEPVAGEPAASDSPAGD